jgi:hypothetical protein
MKRIIFLALFLLSLCSCNPSTQSSKRGGDVSESADSADFRKYQAEQKLLHIRNEVWSKYKSHPHVSETIGLSIDAVFKELDYNVKHTPNFEKPNVQKLKDDIKNKILGVDELKGKEDFIEFCLKNVDDDPRFIERANERIENINGWIHKDTDHVLK